ncbi:MAG TPA: pilus assembly protein PilP [Spongiibacteraceae bacterium]|nr:pilus assembly protein PilP [Spongiibacteraceae bacterium]HCS27252.1 pilus assembly protein PilP [Spongiibacteraceae bacterium]|tara:strand:- start:711 stop:1253 length:543 start_codon:yes stop_codon:yes gene_type:complete
MMLSVVNKLTVVIAASIFLSACGGGSAYRDIDLFMDETKARPVGQIPPIPPFKAYKAFNYSASGLRSPFVRPVEAKQVARLSGSASVKPDFNRKQEYLEQFSLDSMRMVGSLEIDGVRWALIRDSENSVHRVRRGNFLGRNHGRIIESNENHIVIIEIVSDGAEGWVERPRTLEIKTSDG